MRIDAGGNHIGANLFTILQDDARDAIVLDQNLADRRIRADFHAEFPRGRTDGVGDLPRAAAAETPRAERAVNFTHVVVQQNVCGAGRANSEKCADNS